MPINHSRRLKQPSNLTVIDPLTQKVVFYSDYLRMEAQRNTGTTDASDVDSTATTKNNNSSTNGDDGWSDDNLYFNKDDNENGDVASPSRDATSSVLALGSDETADDNTDGAIKNDNSGVAFLLQDQVNKSRSQNPHETRNQPLQAKEALRAKKQAGECEKASSKQRRSKKKDHTYTKTTKSTSKKLSSSTKSTTNKTSTTPKKSKVQHNNKISTQAAIPIDIASSESDLIHLPPPVLVTLTPKLHLLLYRLLPTIPLGLLAPTVLVLMTHLLKNLLIHTIQNPIIVATVTFINQSVMMIITRHACPKQNVRT